MKKIVAPSGAFGRRTIRDHGKSVREAIQLAHELRIGVPPSNEELPMLNTHLKLAKATVAAVQQSKAK